MMKQTFSSAFRATGVLIALASVFLYRYQSRGPFLSWQCSMFRFGCPKSVPFAGTVDSDYVEVETIFRNNFLQGLDVGSSLAIYVNNELVVNLQGGWQNVEERIPYTENTMAAVYSSTKMLSAIVVAQFVQHGLIDYDERIATYWPEFAQGNKEKVTVEDLMQHAAGVGYLDHQLKVQEALDPGTFSGILARQPHNFNGTRTRAYHAVTRGWYENEILKRVDPKKRTVGDVAKSFKSMYGIDWNLSPTEPGFESRLAKIYQAPRLRRLISMASIFLNPSSEMRFLLSIFDKNSIIYKSIVTSAPDQCPMYEATQSKMRAIEGPSYSGYTNALSIAKLAAMMSNKGKAIVPGEPDLLDSRTYAIATQPVPLDYDHAILRYMPALKGGFGVVDNHVMHNVTFIGWTGAGGSVFYWNPEYKIGFGYATNAIGEATPDERTLPILEVIARIAKQKAGLAK